MPRQCADNPHLIQQLGAALAWGELLQVVFTLESSVRHLFRYLILNPETLMKKSDLDVSEHVFPSVTQLSICLTR